MVIDMLVYVLIFTTLFFLALFVGTFYVSYKALALNRKYERFYNGTVEDIAIVSNSIDLIINKRPLLVDDPDVHRMVKGLRIVQEILNEYGDIKKIRSDQPTKNS